MLDVTLPASFHTQNGPWAQIRLLKNWTAGPVSPVIFCAEGPGQLTVAALLNDRTPEPSSLFCPGFYGSFDNWVIDILLSLVLAAGPVGHGVRAASQNCAPRRLVNE